VIGAYLTVVFLHGLWDGLPGVIGYFTGSGLDVFISQSLVGLAGLVILFMRWREAVRLQMAESVSTGVEKAIEDESILQ
jgi:hypothetical protein